MRKQQLILAYYTFFASLALFLWALFFSPKPEGFFLSILFIPTSLYFFLSFIGFFKIQHHPLSETPHAEKHVTISIFILLTLFVSACSIFVFSLTQKNTIPAKPESIAYSSKEIASLKKELANQNAASNAHVLKELASIKTQLNGLKTGMSTTDKTAVMGASVGTVTLKDSSASASIREEKSLSAKVVGMLEFGKNYTYLEKDGSWYLIFGEKEGYIQAHLVKEIVY